MPGRFGALMASVAVATTVAAPCISHATVTTFTLNGTSQLADVNAAIPPLNLAGLLSGRYDDGPSVSVHYPATVVGMDYSIAVGADQLVANIQSTPGDKRALGISQGAIAIAEAKRRLMAMSADQRPAPGAVTFVAIADPTRPGHGALAQLGYQTPDTPYDTVYITREYDGLADLPDRLNVLAIINAAAGIIYVHPNYGELPADIPARNITTTVTHAGGTVTDVLIPNPHLPMLQPLRNLGMNVDGLETVLKPMVDAGYSRNDVEPTPRDEPKAEPKKPRRNVQASDAAHEAHEARDTGTVAPSTAKNDKKPDVSTPAPDPAPDADASADSADPGNANADE